MPIIGADGLPRAGINIHLAPTKRKENAKGRKTRQCYQGKCKVCKKKMGDDAGVLAMMRAKVLRPLSVPMDCQELE